MKTYGLIGYPLSHSFSREFFKTKFAAEGITDSEYRNFPIEDISAFPELLNSIPSLCGLNVTIPYKEKIIPYLDNTDPTAREIGAVNTVKFSREEGKVILTGYNTDAYGFKKSLEEILTGRKKLNAALILGTGGASKAVAWVLKNMGVEYRFVSTSQNSHLRYDDLNKEIPGKYNLIVNTTPLGTFPAVDNCPEIPYHLLDSSFVLYDLVYNPPLTLFLQKGMERGAAVANGLKMLQYQALQSWEIWNS
jgi:shikimate dehydrogenase